MLLSWMMVIGRTLDTRGEPLSANIRTASCESSEILFLLDECFIYSLISALVVWRRTLPSTAG